MEGEKEKRQEIEKREKAYAARMKKHVTPPGVIEFEYHGLNRNEFVYLSPYSPHGFVIEDNRWPTVSHYLIALRYLFALLFFANRQVR